MPLAASELPAHLLLLVSAAEPAFLSIERSLWQASRGEGKWTRLQLVGHLIDSAVNNQQRFVRALDQPRLDWPGYDQNTHVELQAYAGEDPALCVALWSALNQHIAHVLQQVSPPKQSTPCSIGGAPDMTLAELAVDYVAHLEHHLKQLLPDTAVSYSGMPFPAVYALNTNLLPT